MICPICHTNQLNKSDSDCNFESASCVQCKSDLYMHTMIKNIRESLQMKQETNHLQDQNLNQKSKTLDYLFKIPPSFFLLFGTIFFIFIGIRFLSFLERVESKHIIVSEKLSETSLEQLQQMTLLIKQELDLIVDQRQENLALRAQIQKLSEQNFENKQ